MTVTGPRERGQRLCLGWCVFILELPSGVSCSRLFLNNQSFQ